MKNIFKFAIEWINKKRCTCTKVCDCQCPNGKGVRLVSNECPIHNDFPLPNPECPVHSK